jgi:Fe-Mn family superoxide dismutase
MFGQIVSKRCIHLAPKLALENSFRKEGIKGLMSPAQFKTAWVDYQDFLTKNLTLKTVDTEYETRSPMAIAMSTSKRPQESDIFHYASQAHNNHLFFQQLKHNSSRIKANEDELKPQLLNSIKNTFQSFENFKNEFLLAADIISGNGWVFLIEDENKGLKIVSCNNDGTPYFYGRNQSLDLNTTFNYNDYKKLLKYKENIINNVKDYSLPLLCVNVWEHAYLIDYGVSGKADYLEKFWDNIDWNVVNSRLFSNIEM